MIKIGIDAGHGLKTPGKEVPSYMHVLAGTREWKLNNDVATMIETLLLKYENVKVIRLDDATGKVDVPLSERVSKANKNNVDITISCHHNAGIKGGTGGGLEIYRYTNSQKFTKQMQKELYDSIVKETGNRGNRYTPLKEADFYILKYTASPAVLIEFGFMDSMSDIYKIAQNDWAEKCARGVVNWLIKHFNLKKKQKKDMYRFIVNGKQIGAFTNLDNILRNLKTHIGSDEIIIRKIK